MTHADVAGYTYWVNSAFGGNSQSAPGHLDGSHYQIAHDYIMSKCDALDGVTDQIIDNVRPRCCFRR